MPSPPQTRGGRPTRPPKAPGTGGPAGRSATPGRGRKRANVPARRMDFFHLLAAASGAFCGLALYSLITPGHWAPDPPAGLHASATRDVLPRRVHGAAGADGLFHVTGQLQNGNTRPCRRAGVTIRFYDARNRLVTSTVADARAIPPGAERPFAARAHVPGAVRYELTVDYAEF